jgi:hypothetical protein
MHWSADTVKGCSPAPEIIRTTQKLRHSGEMMKWLWTNVGTIPAIFLEEGKPRNLGTGRESNQAPPAYVSRRLLPHQHSYWISTIHVAIKSRRMRWEVHVARMRRRAYRVLVGKPEGKRPLGRPRRTCEYIIKMGIR